MARRTRRYTLETIIKRLEFALGGGQLSIYDVPEKGEIHVLNCVGEGKKSYNSEVAILKKNLSYTLCDEFIVPAGKESDESYIYTTTAEQQAKFVARQHTKYMLELALTCFPYSE